MGEEGESLPVGQNHGVPQKIIVLHGDSVIGQGHRPGGLQGFVVVDLLPLLALGNGGDGPDPGAALCKSLAGLLPDIGHPAGFVNDGSGVGHTGHGGETAGGSGKGTGKNGLFILEAGLAQMDVHIHKPGADHKAFGFNDLSVSDLQLGTHGGDHAVVDEKVGEIAHTSGGVHRAGLTNQNLHKKLLSVIKKAENR